MSVRPRIQRAFLRWLEEKRSRLPFGLTRTRRTDALLTMQIGVAEPHLLLQLSRWSLSVLVVWQGKDWDLLYDNDVVPVRVSNGHVCGLCGRAQQEVFSGREMLWREHLFEPWLRWLTDEVASAQFVLLHQTKDGGVTWATLAPPADERQPTVVGAIPLRRDHSSH